MESLPELPMRQRGAVRAPHRPQADGSVNDPMLPAVSALAQDAAFDRYGVDNTLHRSRAMPLVRRTYAVVLAGGRGETPPPPGPDQPSAAEARIPGHDQPPLCASMPPGWTGLAGRVAEAIEQAIAAVPGDASRSSMASVSIGAFAGPDMDLTIPPTWWLDRRARVVQAELDHRTDAATAPVALACMHA